jgi:hypothetical protein
MRRLGALLLMTLALCAIVHLAWIDIWLRPDAALLLDRRSLLNVGDQAACRGRSRTGTVIALAGARIDDAGKSVALQPNEIALAGGAHPVSIVSEALCRPILATLRMPRQP